MASDTRHVVMRTRVHSWTRVRILMCLVTTDHWTQTIPIFINN